jgi:hypothetical protein
MKYRTSVTWFAALVVILAIGTGGGGAQSTPTWPPAKWPSSVDNPRLQEALVMTPYTAEERRNILSVLTEMSDEARPAWLKTPNRPPHEGFPGLDKYYGVRDFDQATSMPDRKDRLIDIIAKANRVWGVFTINGHHRGSIYGFKGDGKPLQILQFFYRTFDAQGRTIENIFRGEELQLYVALGGKVSFPQDGIKAQMTEGPFAKPGDPPTPAGRGGEPGGRPPIWASWPPPEWPSGVISPKLKRWLTETAWTDEEKQALQRVLETQFVRRDPATSPPPDFSVRPPCGIVCPQGRRGFDYLDELSGFHGYNPPTSVADRFNETEDVIAKGSRLWRVFLPRGHHTGYFNGFAGTGKPIEIREFNFGQASINGIGGRAEELQLYVALGGKLQFPAKLPVPAN